MARGAVFGLEFAAACAGGVIAGGDQGRDQQQGSGGIEQAYLVFFQRLHHAKTTHRPWRHRGDFGREWGGTRTKLRPV